MKHLIFILSAIILVSCGSPKNYLDYPIVENTGLDQLININGYYISPFGCDTFFHSIYKFYPNGVFKIATYTQLSPELLHCFTEKDQPSDCKYILCGRYTIVNNLIKTQVIRQEGGGCVIFRDYRILPGKSIVNISDYVQPEFTKLAYMKNYPSFYKNECEKEAEFYGFDQ